MPSVQIRVRQWGEAPDTMGAKLRCLRKDAGLTQQQLADKVGLSVKTIQSVELNVYSPCWQNFTKLAKFFSVSLDWLAE
ncbi:transcriptional repressor DicA [Caballeronia arvi]|uniref:Transcriptional repressor DicA n=1 Tax=Caballeronia arvi TaxID=1777135 RepID=A0A158HS92_9BURK|nr:helix-turn-helix transcriptional regulator [Caballeronia arvi]SAL47262.1 transcriptional repressor DicA [Caballeronia arvi]